MDITDLLCHENLQLTCSKIFVIIYVIAMGWLLFYCNSQIVKMGKERKLLNFGLKFYSFFIFINNKFSLLNLMILIMIYQSGYTLFI